MSILHRPLKGHQADRRVSEGALTFRAEFASGFRATLTIITQGRATCDWSPAVPTLSDHPGLLQSYRRWRNDCLWDFYFKHPWLDALVPPTDGATAKGAKP